MRILAVDRDAAVRRGIVTMLGAYGDLEPIGVAATAEEAVRQFASILPGVVLIDPASPRLASLVAVRTILTQWPDTRVVTLTDRRDAARTENELAAGVVRCLDKYISADALTDAIRCMVKN